MTQLLAQGPTTALCCASSRSPWATVLSFIHTRDVVCQPQGRTLLLHACRELCSHLATSMGTTTGSFSFARLPTKLKLLVLKEHTAFLQEPKCIRYGRNRRGLNCLDALSHDATDCTQTFRPDAQDLLLLHYPDESRVSPFDVFYHFHIPSPYSHDLNWLRYHVAHHNAFSVRKRGSRASDELCDTLPPFWLPNKTPPTTPLTTFSMPTPGTRTPTA